MKTLSNYTEHAISEALSKHGAFFAFSQSQFEEQAVPGLRYCSLGSGLICPEKNALLLSSDLEKAHHRGIAQDIEENGVSAIILRELLNHEAFYTGDISDTVDALQSYEFSRQQVIEIFNQKISQYA